MGWKYGKTCSFYARMQMLEGFVYLISALFIVLSRKTAIWEDVWGKSS